MAVRACLCAASAQSGFPNKNINCFAADPQHLGGDIGMIGVLQT